MLFFKNLKINFEFIINKCKELIIIINNRYRVNILTYIILLLILTKILLIIYNIYSHSYTIDLFSNLIPSGDKNDTVPMAAAGKPAAAWLLQVVQPAVRWWPSGAGLPAQGWTVVGTALATFGVLSKIPGISPRTRVLGALASAGVSATQITYHSAIENPVGFNRLMWGFSEYRRTGEWPSLDQIAKTTNDKQLSDFASEAVKHADNSTVQSIVNEVNSNKFLPLNSEAGNPGGDFINKLIDLIFKETIQLLKPVHVQGFLDDLIGQRMFIEIILFFLCIFIILLFIIFIINLIFISNKDKIIKRFDNRFIIFYVKYQAFLSRITLFYIPIFIFTGLFTLCNGLYWLVTNQIPYESLNIDLHQFISSNIVLALTLNSNKK
jgi:hypothetical protein